MNKIYTGIGSRSTPPEVLSTFTHLGNLLAEKGFTLRSGRAGGADSAFEIGARCSNGYCEIFIPWNNFSGFPPLNKYPAIIFPQSGPVHDRAIESVKKYHPAPNKLSQGALKLMARNFLQIYGKDIDSPLTDFIICYTSDGKDSGGTGQAIRIANDLNIKVFNAYGYENKGEEFINLIMEYIK